MSRAFVKEADEEQSEVPERPQSPGPNYVTSAGLAALRAQLADLQEQRRQLVARSDDLLKKETLKLLDRDSRYFQGRIETAQVIDPAAQPRDEVAFGAVVRTVDEEGVERDFAIVGEDEADVAAGKVSWVSPLARAIVGARVGETVTWHRPVGDLHLEILSIAYPID